MGDHGGLFEDVVIAGANGGAEGRGDGRSNIAGVTRTDGEAEGVPGEFLPHHNLDDAAVIGIVVVEGIFRRRSKGR